MASNFRRFVLKIAVPVNVALLGPALVVAPSIARAEPSAADKVSARDLLHEGKALRDAGDHAGARKKFEGAYALVPTPVTGFLLARELVAIGLWVEARELLGDIDRMPVKPTETDEGKRSRVDAAALYAEIAPKIPVLEVAITGAPAGKEVALTVDGKSVPASAADQGLRVNPGAHAVVATIDGATQSQSIALVAGQRAKVELVFAQPAPVVPPARAATTPAPTTIAIPAVSSPPLVDARGPSATKWIGLAVLGAGVVVMGVGAIVGLSARSSYDSATRTYCPTGPCTPAGTQGIADARSTGNTATILVGAGAAVAVTGAIVWRMAPSGAAKPGVTSVGVGAGVVTIGGVF